MKRLVVPVLAAGVAAAVLVYPAGAQAPATRTVTLTELNKGSTFAFVDNAPKSHRAGEPSASMGDLITFTNPIQDATGARNGHIYATCTVVVASSRVGKSQFLCTVLIKLKEGQLTGEALVNPSVATSRGTITGGTGAYEDAHGSVVSVSQSNGDSKDTITLYN